MLTVTYNILLTRCYEELKVLFKSISVQIVSTSYYIQDHRKKVNQVSQLLFKSVVSYRFLVKMYVSLSLITASCTSAVSSVHILSFV